MKAETVQRQHLQELRSIKDRPSLKLTPESTASGKRTARKSTNPQKQANTSTNSPLKGDDLKMEQASTNNSPPADPSPPIPVDNMDLPAEDQTKDSDSGSKEESSSSDGLRSDPGMSCVDTSQQAATPAPSDPVGKEETGQGNNPEDSSIDKVWETIRRDMSSGGTDDDDEEEDDGNESKEEGELNTLDEMLLEHHSISHSPMVEEEEEPSDWEDHEPSLEEDAVDQSEGNVKKAVSECVLISSDDEGSPDRRKEAADTSAKNGVELKTLRLNATPAVGVEEEDEEEEEEEEDDERLQLDTSSEISETPSHKRVVQDFEAMNTNDAGLELSDGMKDGTENTEDADLVSEEKDAADLENTLGEDTLANDLIEESNEPEPMEEETIDKEEGEEQTGEEEVQGDEEMEEGEVKVTEGGEELEELDEEIVDGDEEQTEEDVTEDVEKAAEVDEVVAEVDEEVAEVDEEVAEDGEVVAEGGETAEDNEETVDGDKEMAEGDKEETEDVEELAEAGEEVAEAGEEVAEDGEEVAEAGEEEEEAGEEVVEGGDEVAEDGEEVAEGSEEVAEGDEEVPDGGEEEAEAGEKVAESSEEVTESSEEVAEGGEEAAKDVEEVAEGVEEAAEGIEVAEDDVEEVADDVEEVADDVEKVTDVEEVAEDVQGSGKEITKADEKIKENMEKTVEDGDGVAVSEEDVAETENNEKDLDKEMEKEKNDKDEDGMDLTLEEETIPESILDNTEKGRTESEILENGDKGSVTSSDNINSVLEEKQPSKIEDIEMSKDDVLGTSKPTVTSDVEDSGVNSAEHVRAKSNESLNEKPANNSVNDSKTLDLDLEVLLDDDTENVESETSRTEPAQSKEEENSNKEQQPHSVMDKTGADSKKVEDKDVEMIDLEILDCSDEQRTDASAESKVGTSGATTEVSALDLQDGDENKKESGRTEKGDSLNVVKPASREIPEIVELDLDNDSDANQEDADTVPAKLEGNLNESGDSVKVEDSTHSDEEEKKNIPKVLERRNSDPVEVDLSLTDMEDMKDGDLLKMDIDDSKLDDVKDVIMNSDANMESESNRSSRKRHLSQESQNNHLNCSDQAKKSRLDLSEEPLEDALNQLEALRKKEKKGGDATPKKLKLTKEVLEEFITRRIAEHINNSQKSIIGELRSRCDGLEKNVEKWRKRAQALQSSINELNAELAKHQKKPRGPTRTVGINVRISTNEPLRPLNAKPTPPPQAPPKPMETVVRTNAPMTVTTTGGPVPMHLIPNLASSPNKSYVTPPASAGAPAPAQKQVPQSPTATPNQTTTTTTIKFIDLTTEDEETALKNVRQQQVQPAPTAVPAPQHQQQQQQQQLQQLPQQLQAQPQQIQLPVSIHQAISGASSSFSAGGTVLTNALARSAAPVTLTSTGPPLLNMPVPVTMQIIPNVPTTGVGMMRGPRPAMGLPAGIAPPGTRVTTYLVPNGPPTMGAPRQIVPIGSPGVVPPPRPGAPLQTFLLRMNTPATSTFTMGSNVSPAFGRGPPNVTLTPRNVISSAATVVQTSLLNTAPKNVSTTLKPVNPSNTVVIPLTPKPVFQHPAPFPQQPTYAHNPQLKGLPPKPALKISKVANGIVLSWNLTMNSAHAEIAKYQLYAYQEGTGPPLPTLWKKVGDVKALPLPMACTLTQFVEGNKYHFAVCAVDKHNRTGPFSDPSSILLSGK